MSRLIVVLDDSLTVRMDLKERFEAAKFSVKPCATAAEAREILSREKADLIVLDVQLPDVDGIDFLKELKSGHSTGKIPVIVLSSEVEIVDRIRGISGGADEYVGKPYNASYLITKAQELLRDKGGIEVSRSRHLILVIDDSSTYREALKESLVKRGYDVETAETGEAGLRSAFILRPDALIVDGMLPGIDGATVVRRIKSDVALRTIPCLLLTASRDVADESKALDAGADSYAHKDDDAEGIAARLTAILKSSLKPSPGLEAGLWGPKKILTIDDSRTYLEALAEPLREEGYDVIMALSGDKAFSILEVQKVDCILLDRVMPELSGQEVCSKIKSHQHWRDIPVLMLTAHESREAMLESFGAGADDYVPKSSEFDVLKARVRAQLRRKQFEDEGRRLHAELLRKEAEASEARANKELAETRARLLRELEQTNGELARANKELEAFSYSVSHDLKAPLRGILGFSEILLQEHAMALNAEGLEYLKRIAASAKTMALLIDGLLDLARLARLEFKSTVVDLSALADKVMADLRGAAPEREVEWVLARELNAYGDPRLLQSVLQNLLSNAWKYTSKKQNACVEFGKAEMDGLPVYYVRDNGAGFDMAYANKLFGAFQRLHSKDEFEGTGIGLASVQRIIHRHKGRIWAEAQVGQGATFYFTLDIAE